MEYDRACQIADLYKTPRYRQLEVFEKYIDGSVYDGRPDFFNPGGDVPLLGRKPCVVFPIGEIAIGSHVDMVLGEKSWPRLKVAGSAISDEAKKKYETLIANVVDQAELRSQMAEALEIAMGARSVALVGCIDKGQIGVQLLSTKGCTLERDSLGRPTRLVETYPYVEEVRDPVNPGKWTWMPMIYRRVIDARRDDVFIPVVATENATAEPITIDPAQSRVHNLGFCPVEWYAFRPRLGRKRAGPDGRAIHERLLDEIDALNIGLSQRTRSAHYAGDPQLWETGVDKDEQIAPQGTISPGSIVDHTGKVIFGRPNSPHRTGRKKGPGAVWRYESHEARVGMLTLPGDAFDAVNSHCKDILSICCEGMYYVRLEYDQARMGTDVSGRALEILHKPQVLYDSKVREDFGPHGIVAAIDLLMRVALAAERNRPGSVYLEGLKEAVSVLETFEQTVEDPNAAVPVLAAGQEPPAPATTTMWMPPQLTLEWGPMFPDTAADIKLKTEAAGEARSSKLISKKTAVGAVAPLYGVVDIEEELAEIEKEPEEHGSLEGAIDALAKGQLPPKPNGKKPQLPNDA